MNNEQVRNNVLLCRVGVKQEYLSELLSAVSALPDNQRSVIEARFALADGKFRSMSDAQKFLGVSRQRVEQIEKRAVEMLRASLSGRGALKDTGYVRINKHNIKWGREFISRAELS